MRTSFSLGGCYDNEGVAERLWLGGGYYGAPVVLEVTDTMSYRYVMRDHLGSITHVYTAEPIPTLLQELSYDAWGRLRNPDTHEAYASDSVPTPILGRGYTGHRHIAGIGLIDMNARLYDPMLGRFLSPDPHIQSPDCPQNNNRYTYCLNNPLRYTDPTGEVIWSTSSPDAIIKFLNELEANGWSLKDMQRYSMEGWKILDVGTAYFNDSTGILWITTIESDGAYEPVVLAKKYVLSYPTPFDVTSDEWCSMYINMADYFLETIGLSLETTKPRGSQLLYGISASHDLVEIMELINDSRYKSAIAKFIYTCAMSKIKTHPFTILLDITVDEYEDEIYNLLDPIEEDEGHE